MLGRGLEQQLVVGERALGPDQGESGLTLLSGLMACESPAASTSVYKSVQLLPLPAARGEDFILLLKSMEDCGSEREMDIFKDTQQENGEAMARTQAS